MNSTVITSPVVVLPASLDAEAREFLALCAEARVTVRTHAPQFSELVNLTVLGVRYFDKVASCACADLRVFKYADAAYTVCTQHGLQAAGYFRREYLSAKPLAAKAVRHG
jgi:hypothetical protein